MKNVIIIAIYVTIAITINSLIIANSLAKYQRVPRSIGEIRIGHTYTWQEEGENKGCKMTVEEISRIVRPEPFNGRFIEVERVCGYMTCNGSPIDGVGDDEVCYAAR